MSEYKAGELQACLRCGGMFIYSGVDRRLCRACKKKDDEEFQSVKNYIYDNPSATIMETSQVTGVRAARIKSYLREGRLIIPDESPIFLNCDVCGASIKFGKVCRQCADTLSAEFKKAMSINEYNIGERPKNLGPAKMRFLNRDTFKLNNDAD